ncbi:MAG: glycoside hydrolase family 2 protein [Ruminococcaceae bacterium]|nr:glycoside hydrolase family 2 protein [Oscillospiraceae bacterium]
MRTILNLNKDWLFKKPSEDAVAVDLPHSWNSVDGQDGGADYFRGTCRYTKTLKKTELPESDCYYLEIRGANSSADVYADGEKLAHHDGGYSTWRVDITKHIKDETVLEIDVDNAANDTVYPQMADFTFYGGIYRDVNLICVPESHFDLDYYGTPGLKVTPEIKGKDAEIEIEAYLTNKKDGQTLRYTIYDAEGGVVATKTTDDDDEDFDIKNVHLWHGRKDPYLYTARVELLDGDKVLDEVSTRFGCRTFRIDPNEGFFLNGEKYPLHGVSRHQDRWGIGNALLPEHHKEDMELICEVGANTIRLAHYQHDQYFYDLCDEKGMVIWAEIPYISQHMATGRENTISQMKELITQNYNHASIVVWGLSNEITMHGAADPDLIENHRILNDLCKKMDKTRLTTIACLSMCDPDSEYIKIPDVISYNHYFGWYGGETSMNGPWFDKFHKNHPDIPIGCSEYGCEALNWHTSKPQQGDYTEEYQAYYHEELIKQLFTREYIWSTHVWNMFDFGADARQEGGENGQNHKGLVTMDRKYKKDSFYAYKAWLSDEPFVHLCGKRYVDRVEEVTKVTVYSNLPEVELFANGKSLGKKTAADHFFYFDVPNEGETALVAAAGDCKDESTIRKVDTINEEYVFKEKGAILNWFDITEPEGYLSINNKFSTICSTFKGKLATVSFVLLLLKKFKGTKKGDGNGEKKKGGGMPGGIKPSKELLQMAGAFTPLRIANLIGAMEVKFTKEELLALNAKLNKIKAPKE